MCALIRRLRRAALCLALAAGGCADDSESDSPNPMAGMGGMSGAAVAGDRGASGTSGTAGMTAAGTAAASVGDAGPAGADAGDSDAGAVGDGSAPVGSDPDAGVGDAARPDNPGPPYTRECTLEQPNECRLCEDQTSCEDPDYTDNGDGTVTSSCCGFVWQRDTAWMLDPASPADDCLDRPGAPGCYDFDGAQAYCAALDLAGGGWRLPTIAELTSLFDRSLTNQPRLDPVAFPDPAVSDEYWSSSPSADNPNRAWAMSFGGLSIGQRPKNREHFARCMR